MVVHAVLFSTCIFFNIYHLPSYEMIIANIWLKLFYHYYYNCDFSSGFYQDVISL